MNTLYTSHQNEAPSEIKSRRDFISRFIAIMGTATAAAVLYPVIKYLIPPKSGEANINQVKLTFRRTDIETDPKKSKIFRFGRQLGIIILDPGDELRAFSAECTHLDCTVQNRPEEGVLWCACHNGKYDLEGRNISGPPPRPLEKFIVSEVNGNIFVSKGKT